MEGWEEDLSWLPVGVPVSGLHWEGNFLYFWMTVPCHLLQTPALFWSLCLLAAAPPC